MWHWLYGRVNPECSLRSTNRCLSVALGLFPLYMIPTRGKSHQQFAGQSLRHIGRCYYLPCLGLYWSAGSCCLNSTW
ncbi:hypothetical protein BDW75DRAFT_198406 [Aspergillus navahoensis]